MKKKIIYDALRAPCMMKSLIGLYYREGPIKESMSYSVFSDTTHPGPILLDFLDTSHSNVNWRLTLEFVEFQIGKRKWKFWTYTPKVDCSFCNTCESTILLRKTRMLWVSKAKGSRSVLILHVFVLEWFSWIQSKLYLKLICRVFLPQ